MKIKSIAIFLILLLGCTSGKTEVEIAEPVDDPDPITWSECSYQIGDHPCDITLKDQNNKDWNLYSHYGNVILVDLSTQWCGYCHVAAADVEMIQNEYEDEKFIYATILVEDASGNPATLELIQAWAEHFQITSAPVLVGSRDLVDSAGETGWEVTGWPTFALVDHEMVIRGYIRGYSNSAIITAIDNLLLESKSDSGQN